MLIPNVRGNHIWYVYWLLMHRVAVLVSLAVSSLNIDPLVAVMELKLLNQKISKTALSNWRTLGHLLNSHQALYTALDDNLRATITSNAALSHLFAQPLLLSFTHSGLVIIIIIIIINLIGSCHSSRTSQRSCRPHSSRRHPSLRRGDMGHTGSRVLSLLWGMVGGIVGDWPGGLAL